MNLLSKFFLVIKTVINFPTAILDKLGLLHGQVIYRLRNSDLRFIARAGTEDLAEIVVVASGSEYKMNLINLPKNPNVIDLGGHIGSFSIPLAKKLKNTCNIYTFEPDKANFEILSKNIELNKTKSVHAKNLAVSDFTGQGHLKTNGMNTDAYYLDVTKNESLNCRVTTLEKAISSGRSKLIDLLKVDIEGGEYKILKHKESLEYIKKNVHYIFIEHHPVSNSLNGAFVKKTLSGNFKILDQTINTFTFENKNWKGN